MQEKSVKQNNEDLMIKIYLCILLEYRGTHESTICSAVPHVKKSFRGDLTPEKKNKMNKCPIGHYFRKKKKTFRTRNVVYMESTLEHD